MIKTELERRKVFSKGGGYPGC